VPTDPEARQMMGTVGAVALDAEGNLAAATSTGGLTNKRYGRLGDSPIAGAGTFADNTTCAVSGTGIGEDFIRNAVGHDMSARMEYLKQTMPEAAEAILKHPTRQVRGGIIGVDHAGRITMQFNTRGMARAAGDSTGLREVHAQ
jgi:beta-aspartyl-peptidase (threonine type)